MLLFKLALKNLIGAGIRTWLNVIVLSLSFVVIILSQGLYIGMNEQASDALIDGVYGGGQYWQHNYDPYDPFALQDSHAPVPKMLQTLIDDKQAAPVLLTQGTIYPEGRIQPIVLKGITVDQKTINFPSEYLQADQDVLPALIGSRMAKSSQLKLGDYVTLRWRDRDGTFDATDIKIVHVMKTSVPTIDNNQVWIPLNKLQDMLNMPNEATIVIVDKTLANPQSIPGWDFKDQDFLLSDIKQIVKQKSISASIMYFLLLFLAMLAIFDTQVLSIFRRQKEIGTLIALGMTRSKVIRLFTIEGALHGLLAALIGAIWGSPLMITMAKNGWKLPDYTDEYGIALGEKLYPFYSMTLVSGTVLLIMITVTIVSFLPTRRIAKMNPTDALRGRRK